MPSNRSTVIDITYDDARTGERVRERKIQEIPYEELEGIRNRELALVTRPWDEPAPLKEQQLQVYREQDQDDDDDDNYYTVRRRRTQEYSSRDRPASYAAPRYYDNKDYYYDRRPSRRRQSYDEDDKNSDSSRERRRSQRRHRKDRSPSSKSRSSAKIGNIRDNPARIQDEEDEGICWYSGKKRSEANFYEKNFDASYDGILAAAAGAAMGVVTARHYAGEKNKTAKTLGAAAVGAVAFNAGENWFRIFTEEREERKEAKERRQGIKE